MKHRQITDSIKMMAGCEICGYKIHPAALTFDHLDPVNKYRTKNGKLVHLSDMIKGNRYSMNTILKEIKKCRILCFNCHMETTYSELRKDYQPYPLGHN
jgi:hypothetical protein